MAKASSDIITPEILSELRRLYFQTRRLADEGISGRYKSAFLGHGIEFEEVREYVPGDDIRSIDWKVTARSRKPFVKSYREERELTVVIAVDVSASTRTGSRSQLREDLIAKLGGVLTLIALRNNDRVGLVTFSDEVHSYFPPRKTRSAVWRILHEVLLSRSQSRKTDLAGMCRFLSGVLKRPSVIFIVSDFFDANFDSALAILSKKHDVTAVCVSDPLDEALPDVGLVQVQDPESGEVGIMDTSSKGFCKWYQRMVLEQKRALRSLLRRYRIGILEVSTARPFIGALRRYLEGRKSKSSLTSQQKVA